MQKLSLPLARDTAVGIGVDGLVDTERIVALALQQRVVGHR